MSGEVSSGSATPKNPLSGAAAGGGSRRPPIWLIVVIAVVVVAIVIGVVVFANSDRGGPTSSPTPSVSVTPTPTPTPTPDPSAAKAAKAAKDHADAEFAVKAELAETYRLIDSGAGKPSKTLEKYVAGDELSELAKALKSYKEQGVTGHGSPELDYVDFLTEYPSTTQVLSVCENPNGFYSLQHGKRLPVRATFLTYRVTMTRLQGVWKRTASSNTSEVKSCAK